MASNSEVPTSLDRKHKKPKIKRKWQRKNLLKTQAGRQTFDKKKKVGLKSRIKFL